MSTQQQATATSFVFPAAGLPCPSCGTWVWAETTTGLIALAAILWQSIGPLGQFGLLAGAVLILGISSVLASRRIPATGVALSVVTVGAWLTLSSLAAHAVNEHFLRPAEPELTVMLAATTVTGLLAGRLWRMTAWSAVGMLALPVTVMSGAVLVGSHTNMAVVLALTAALLAAIGMAAVDASYVRRMEHRTTLAVTSLLIAPLPLLGSLALSWAPANIVLVAAVLSVIGLVSMVTPTFARSAPVLFGIATGASVGFGFGTPWLSSGIVLAVAAVGALSRRWARVISPVTGGAAIAIWMVFAWVAYSRYDAGVGWAYATLLAGFALLFAVRAIRDRQVLVLMASAAFAILASFVYSAMIDARTSVTVLPELYSVPIAIIVMGYGLLLRLVRPKTPLIASFVASALVLLASAAAFGVYVSWRYAAVLIVLGATTAASAIRHRQMPMLVGSAAASGMAALDIVALLSAEATHSIALEWYTVPLAVVFGAYAVVAERQYPGLPSLATFGPSVALVLIPTAVFGAATGDLPRVYIVMVLGVVGAVVGIASRRWGLLVPSAIALVIVATKPFIELVSSLPSWLAYSAAGLILVVVGARFEQVQNRARRAGRWVGDNMR